MNYIDAITAYIPENEQERQDHKVILQYIEAFPHNVLLRENQIAHITSSGFIMNETLDRVLLIHHNIRNTWAWPGGHADGDEDLLAVAVKEAKEETGIQSIRPLSPNIASVDIFPVFGHWKHGVYVNTHLHLSIAYLLIADDKEKVRVNEAENSGVEWFPVVYFTGEHFDQHDLELYTKLIHRARQNKNKMLTRL
ncbi:MAG TPA: NUDIX hydrolase [Bacillota bacterium]|nr:NUDIX hydrolase [Bacillota bacterium]HPT88625.1 NUDIX hydrolase [Bacillota bacterium]